MLTAGNGMVRPGDRPSLYPLLIFLSTPQYFLVWVVWLLACGIFGLVAKSRRRRPSQ